MLRRFSPMRWFRFYAEAVYDPKVQRLPAAMFRQWVNLLCLASLNEGTLPDSAGIGFALHLSPKATENLLCELIDRQLLDTDGITVTPHNWEGRQYQSDSSTERMRKHRNNGVTPTVTPPSQAPSPDRLSRARPPAFASARQKQIQRTDSDSELLTRGGGDPSTRRKRNIASSRKET